MARTIILLALIIIGGLFRLWKVEDRFFVGAQEARILIASHYKIANGILEIDPNVIRVLLMDRFGIRAEVGIYIAVVFLFFIFGKTLLNKSLGIFFALTVALSPYLVFKSSGLSPTYWAMASLALAGIFFVKHMHKKTELGNLLVSLFFVFVSIFFREEFVLEGRNIIEMWGIVTFGKSEAGYFIALITVGSILVLAKKKLLGKALAKIYVLGVLLLFSAVNSIGVVMFMCTVTAWVLYTLYYSLKRHDELLFWICFGFSGFWLMQNWELVSTPNKNVQVLELKKYIDERYSGKLAFYEIENSKNSLLPLMYFYQLEDRVSQEGKKIVLLDDPKMPQVFEMNEYLMRYAREVSPRDVYLGSY